MIDSISGINIVKAIVFIGLERCHKESTEAIINMEAIRINGAKIVL